MIPQKPPQRFLTESTLKDTVSLGQAPYRNDMYIVINTIPDFTITHIIVALNSLKRRNRKMMFPHVGDRFRLVYGRNLLPELTEGLNNYLVVADGFVYENIRIS